MIKKGVYAGSFDPITNGHMWMIKEGSKLFDEFVVVLGNNPDKHYTFSVEERLRLIEESTRDMENVKLNFMENCFLVRYAESIGANYILRGIRTENDYSFERVMKHINSDINSQIKTVFLIPPREIAEVSSSMVKGLIGPEGWQDIVEKYVPLPVYKIFLKKFSKSE